MKTRTLLNAAAALALLLTGSAQADPPFISGRLTILQNQFILKLDEPFEHDDSAAGDGSEVITSAELHVKSTDPEERKALRALVGKYVKFPYASVRGRKYPSDARDLVLEFPEGFFETHPQEPSPAAEASPSPSPSSPATSEPAAPAPVAEGIDYSPEVRPYLAPLEEWEEK